MNEYPRQNIPTDLGGQMGLRASMPFVYWALWGFGVLFTLLVAAKLSAIWLEGSSIAALLDEAVRGVVFIGLIVAIPAVLLIAAIGFFLGPHGDVAVHSFSEVLFNNRVCAMIVGGALAVFASTGVDRVIETLNPPPPEPATLYEQIKEEAAGAFDKLKSWWSE